MYKGNFLQIAKNYFLSKLDFVVLYPLRQVEYKESFFHRKRFENPINGRENCTRYLWIIADDRPPIVYRTYI